MGQKADVAEGPAGDDFLEDGVVDEADVEILGAVVDDGLECELNEGLVEFFIVARGAKSPVAGVDVVVCMDPEFGLVFAVEGGFVEEVFLDDAVLLLRGRFQEFLAELEAAVGNEGDDCECEENIDVFIGYRYYFGHFSWSLWGWCSGYILSIVVDFLGCICIFRVMVIMVRYYYAIRLIRKDICDSSFAIRLSCSVFCLCNR